MSEEEVSDKEFAYWKNLYMREKRNNTYDKAFARYEQQFITWLYDNFLICNGDMLVELMENPAKFEEFMAEQHPEIGELI